MTAVLRYRRDNDPAVVRKGQTADLLGLPLTKHVLPTFGAEASRCGNVLDPPAEAGIHRMMPGRFPTRRAVLQAAGAAAWMAHARGQDLRPKMGMWVWGERVLSSDGMTAFADTHGIDTLFVYVSPAGATALLDGKASAVAAVQAMREGSRRVYAVAGEPDWSLGGDSLPAHAAILVRLAMATRLFDGLQFDVEPNALSEWSALNSRAALIAGTVKFYAMLRASAPGVVIDAVVNPVFAMLPSGSQTFLEALVHHVNSVSIMAYRASIARSLDWAAPAVMQVAAAKRTWRLGVLVDANPNEPGTSWFGTPREKFVSAMQSLDSLIATRFPHSDYAGLTIEGYDGLALIYAN